MGRKKLWAENVNLSLPEGAKAEMDAVLVEGEDRLDLIREGIRREVQRRKRAAAKESSATLPLDQRTETGEKP